MPNITNKHYKEFMNSEIITLLKDEDIERALDNVVERYRSEGRALIIALYLTGARPNEVLKLMARNIIKEGSHIKIEMEGSKGGKPRHIFIRYKNRFIKELYKYSRGLFPDMYLFYHYRGSYSKMYVCRGKETKGQIKYNEDISSKLRYYFRKWFKGILEEAIPPYYLRHNRFSEIAEKGGTDDQIMFLKGSRSIQSVRPYKHMSKHTAKEIAKLIG